MTTPDKPTENSDTSPDEMRAIVLDEFGSAELLGLGQVPVPELDPSSVLIRVEAAGIGSWDPFEREGGYAEMLGMNPGFPYILGSDGAGTISALGEDVDGFEVGDRVFGSAFLSPRGGFYAAFTAVDSSLIARVPSHLTTEQAGGLAGIGITALRGLEEVLSVGAGDRFVVVGASGGVGHLALQLAHARDADVLAIASGPDGVELCTQIGAAVAVDGHHDVRPALKEFAPDGCDAALILTGGPAADAAIRSIHASGRAAIPNGVEITPPNNSSVVTYNGEPDDAITRQLIELVNRHQIQVHVDLTYTPDQISNAHEDLGKHHLGKLILDTRTLHQPA